MTSIFLLILDQVVAVKYIALNTLTCERL